MSEPKIKPADLDREAQRLIDDGKMPPLEELLAAVASVREKYRDKYCWHVIRSAESDVFPQSGTEVLFHYRIEWTKHLVESEDVMSIATEILSLRRDQSSSVATLLALLDWQHAAQDRLFAETRGYAVAQAADLVLLNVAVHALEAQDNVPSRQTRRTIRSFFRKRHRSDTPHLAQRKRKFA